MTTKRRSRRRLKAEFERGHRQRLSFEMEQFLSGNSDVFTDDKLLSTLIAEKYFIDHIYRVTGFTDVEKSRLERLEKRYREWRLASDLKEARNRAEVCKVLRRFTILMDREEYREKPDRAFAEAIGPGPNSIVRDVPIDEESA